MVSIRKVLIINIKTQLKLVINVETYSKLDSLIRYFIWSIDPGRINAFFD